MCKSSIQIICFLSKLGGGACLHVHDETGCSCIDLMLVKPIHFFYEYSKRNW